MSGQRATPKNIYGAKKIDAFAAEKAKRRDEHEQAAIEHDRRTQESRQKYAYYIDREQRLNDNHRQSEIKAAEQQAALQKQIQDQKKLIEEHAKTYNNTVREGEKATEISNKYKAYLEMESDELKL